MSVEVRALLLVVGVVLFCVEAVRSKSFGWAGAAAVTFIPMWDALEAT